MGPEPMTSTERRSSRLDMARAFHQRAERVELPRRVVRARRRLGVVLHAERGRVEQPDPLDHPVVEVDVADLGPAERRVKRGIRLLILQNGQPMAGLVRSRAAAGAGLRRVRAGQAFPPGPLEKNTPSGPAARISAAVAVAGSTCTRQPRAAIAAGVAALMPRSTAATRYRACVPGGGLTW